MTQVEGIPYRRHGPSAALRAFLDPLDPGDYFDCGRARLHGLDDALLEEARHRGRTVGDDSFQLVATDMGLIFCRPSISFAIAARWEDISLIRPRGGDPVVLPVTWPRHGELKFTVSKRLAGNIFRRWLQLRMLAARRARKGQSDRFGRHELRRVADSPVLTGGHRVDLDSPDDDLGGAELSPLELAAALGVSADGVPVPDDGPPVSADGVPVVGEIGEGPTGPVAGRRPVLNDDDLERVRIPKPDTTPTSWIGSLVSVAVVLVVLSSFVLVVAVSVGVHRRAVVDGGDLAIGASPVAAADDLGRTTIDHRRFGPAADPSVLLDARAVPESAVLTPIGAESSGAVSGGVADVKASPDQARLCNSNYSGCVQDVDGEGGAADVDCPGDGDGPFFAAGEVVVMGEDVYGLDTDGDGVGCEADQPAGEAVEPPGPSDRPAEPVEPAGGAEGFERP